MDDEPERPDDAPAPAGGMNGANIDLSITLTKPIQAHGEEIKILKWREPTAADIERAGNPIVIDMFAGDSPRLTFDERKMSAMIAQLAAIPPSSVKMISASDWNTIAWKLVGFFMPRLGTGT